MWRETARGRRRRGFSLPLSTNSILMSLRIGDEKEKTVIGAALNLRSLDPLRHEIFSQRDDIVGGKRHMIHAVGGLRIWRRAETNPLLARHVAHGPAGSTERPTPARECRRKAFSQPSGAVV